VALLAGVSTAWYTQLEQGQNVHPTAAVIDAIGAALQLSADGLAHLRHLAGIAPEGAAAFPAVVGEHLEALLADLTSCAACVMTACLDVIAANDAFEALVFASTEASHEDRNLLWHTFANPLVRQQVRNWADVTPHMVSLFRAGQLEHPAVDRFDLINQELASISLEFRECVRTYVLRDSVGGFSQVHDNPIVGEVTTYGIQLAPVDLPGTILFAMRGVGESDRAKLKELAEWHAQRSRGSSSPRSPKAGRA